MKTERYTANAKWDADRELLDIAQKLGYDSIKEMLDAERSIMERRRDYKQAKLSSL